MKNAFILLFVLLLSPSTIHCVEAFEKPSEKLLLVDFDAYFQAGESILKIYADGTLSHSEMVCCPPTLSKVPENKLSSGELADLKNLINAVIEDKTPAVVKKNQKFGLGYRNGNIDVYIEGKKMNIENLTRFTTDSGTITYNPSRATRNLLKWLYKKKIVENELEIF